MQRMNCGLMELKLASDDMTFEGYGAIFGNVDSHGDVIEPGAFASFLADVKSGKESWPSMLSQHGALGMSTEDLTPVGVWADLSEDGVGLRVSGRLADTARGRELHTLMKMSPRPAIDGLSIGYIAKEWEPRSKPEDPRRRLKRIDLAEISPVTFPANRLARVASVKSIENLTALSEIEDFLREAGGFSRGEAKALVARVKAARTRDAADVDDLMTVITNNIQSLKGA